MRQVNWRATARRGSLQVETDRHPERSSDVVLLLDTFQEARDGASGTLDSGVQGGRRAGPSASGPPGPAIRGGGGGAEYVLVELAGVVTPARLLRRWRWAVIIIVVVAAVFTPSSDPFSMLALAVPLVAFYFISIGIGKLLGR